MDQKYKIVSISTVMPVIVNFENTNNPSEIKSIQVGVDYANEKVYFENKNDEIDYFQLQETILNALKPSELEPCFMEVCELVNQKMSEMRSGNYGYDMRSMDVY